MTKEQIKALREFAKELIKKGWAGCHGGEDIQDAAERFGLIVAVECTKSNEHIWRNLDGMEYAELGDHFYQFAPWLK